MAGIVNVPAALIILLLTAMLIGGTKESARLNNIMVAIKLFVVRRLHPARRRLRHTSELAPLRPG